MKKIQWLFLLIALPVLVSACGQKEPAEATFTQGDLALLVDGAEYRCGMDIETATAHLGDGYEYAEGMSCDYDGLDKTFTYEIATFYTNPLAQGDMIEGVYTRHPSVRTAKGIAVGSTREDVLAAYGRDCEDLGDLLIYRAGEPRPSLSFELDADGVVWAIYLTMQPV